MYFKQGSIFTSRKTERKLWKHLCVNSAYHNYEEQLLHQDEERREIINHKGKNKTSRQSIRKVEGVTRIGF